LKIPIFGLQGGRDYQVTNADFDIWKKELAMMGGRRSSSIHRIGACSTAAPDQAQPSPLNYAIPGNVGQDVVDVINDIAHCSEGNAATPTVLRQLRPRIPER
jgi:hypothetical protein